jgi:hypothetical protein
MKIFSEKKSDELKKLWDVVDIYARRIYESYNLDSNINNLIGITNFFRSFTSLPEEDFKKKMVKYKKSSQEFLLLYCLVNDDKCASAVDVLLSNTKNTVKSEDMGDYVKYMKKSATNRLNKVIEKFDELIEERNKENKIQNFKN